MPSDLDLASLLASRLCHDVVGPVGAIQNGLELMAEDESMAEMALELIKKSAAQATAKLQFARMAYGAAGGAEVIDPGEAGRLTAGVFAGERAALDWQWGGPAVPRVPIKLAMLIATYALGCVPRGGTVTVRYEDETLTVEATGAQLRVPPFLEVLTDGGEITDPRAIQPLCVERLAASVGWRIAVDSEDGAMTFRTEPR
ncbi:histidine phosphotransferase family protein [Acuticoccus sp. M5D2P5]|uniref:histidine phosphotransferase family protein n=1 Tax=Acuticoccus kalidii TaxID=2910977 RepID=UPI001F40B72E|nr:histidine phosphotransferase family protein [Acuticoccus kalidii]MCF3931861.1 histidine phosphotransferase family protein [Acuticoccus kalidii]